MSALPRWREAGEPPRARRRPVTLSSPHGVRIDDYAWLRDDERSSPEVLTHLLAENAHADRYFAGLSGDIDRLAQELRVRQKDDDESVPVYERGYWYYTRYEAGLEYPVYARRPGSMTAPEEILLDLNALSVGHEHYAIGSLEVSDDNRLLAYTEDTVGRLEFTLKVRDIATGRDLGIALYPVEDEIAWTADNGTVVYVRKDPDTLLGHEVYAHVLGSTAPDRLLYTESDSSYFLCVYRGRSMNFIYVVSQSTLATEYRYARADDPDLALSVVAARRPGIEYHVDDRHDRFLVLTNEEAVNFRLLGAPVASVSARASWTELVGNRTDVLLGGVDAFARFIVLSERVPEGPRLRVLTDDGNVIVLSASGPSGALVMDDNPDFDATSLRYVESTPTTPDATYDIALPGGELTLKKVEDVPGVDLSPYVTEFLYAPARDGARVPVTLIRRRDVARDGTAPLYQLAYGAYGISYDATFSVSRLSLLERGFVCAIAHVRGGQELGRAWYDSGRRAAKQHSFDDFIDVSRHLVAERYVDPTRLIGSGGSAGGLLVAVVANEAPTDYLGLVAHVPFVDVLSSMLDEDLPLTSNEYDEWGDPRKADDYALIAGYSPQDNVSPKPYPALYVTAGLWDGQVPYWEPAKWVQKVRAASTSGAPVVLRVNLEAGHGGRSGRYARLREIAEEYAFVLDLAGLSA